MITALSPSSEKPQNLSTYLSAHQPASSKSQNKKCSQTTREAKTQGLGWTLLHTTGLSSHGDLVLSPSCASAQDGCRK